MTSLTPRRLLVATVLGLASLWAQAQAVKAADITISHPYARATAPGQPTGGGFLKLDNGGKTADRLLSASAEVSKSVELHSMKMEGDVMRMRQVEGIDIAAGQTVELKPGGLHIMFIGLKAPLKQGESFPMKLTFEKAGEVTVNVKVEGGAGPGHMKH